MPQPTFIVNFTLLFQIKNDQKAAGDTVSRLIIRQTKMNDSAEFSCMAENRFGSANTTFALIVEVCIQYWKAIYQKYWKNPKYSFRIFQTKFLSWLCWIILAEQPTYHGLLQLIISLRSADIQYYTNQTMWILGKMLGESKSMEVWHKLCSTDCNQTQFTQ